MDFSQIQCLSSKHHPSQPTYFKRQFLVIAVFLLDCFVSAGNTQTPPSPLSIPPSGYWDGLVISWSTFYISIGTPPQSVRLMPSITGSVISPVLQGGCLPGDAIICYQNRGTLFNPSESSTWTEIGGFDLGWPEAATFGFGGNNASFGFDNTSFSGSSNNAPSAFAQTHQIIEGVVTKQMDIGMFGLSPQPVNLSSSSSSNPSLLAVLKNQSSIPSLSWGYIAGAGYKTYVEPINAFGSLTLGGYDTSRFIKNNATFPFGSDPNRKFIASLANIASNSSSSLILSGNIDVAFDSVLTDLWLPPQVCERLANVLRLQYNASENRYWINHTVLLRFYQERPQLSFEFDSPNAGAVVISLPLEAIVSVSNRNISKPDSVGFLSLRQAHNATQYTLGRSFLQEAYMIADYERSNFSIFQAASPEATMPQQIVAIHPVEDLDISPPDHSPSLSPATVAAIVLGATFLITMLGLLFFWRRQKREKVQKATSENNEAFSKPELHPETSRRQEVAATPVRKGGTERRESGPLEIHSPLDGEEMPTLVSMAELPSPTAELEGSRHWLRRVSQALSLK